MRHPSSLNLLRTFDVAARHLSFTLAADELCITPSAVSQQIRAAGRHLGSTGSLPYPPAVRSYLIGCSYFFVTQATGSALIA